MKNKCILLVLCSLFIANPVVAEALLFSDGFESGSLAEPDGQSAKWIVFSNTGDGEKNDTAGPDGVDPDFTVEVTSSEPLAGGYSLVIKDNAPDKRIGVIGAFGKQWRDAPVVEVSFKARVKPSGGRNNNAVYLRTDPGDKRVGVRWFGDESLQCLVDGRWRTFAQYEPGKINQYRIVVNSTDGTFDVWVNDEQALTGSPLGGDPNLGIDRVEFNSGVISASVVEWAVDDIKVTAR